VIATLVVAAAPAAADEGGAHNIVAVVNHGDDSLRSRARANIAEDAGPTVANENLAEVYASCTDCRSVAVAVQVVVVEGPVQDFEPLNGAIVENEGCLRCMSFGYARQFFLYTTGPFHLSEQGAHEVHTLDDELQALADSSEAFPQLEADLDQVTAQLVAVVQGEIQQSGATTTELQRREVQESET